MCKLKISQQYIWPSVLWLSLNFSRLFVSSVRWTRREEADFYRVVSTFGVVFDTQRQKFDWTQFRAFARLDKKTDESLEKYYYSFIAMCKRVCRMQIKTETGEFVAEGCCCILCHSGKN